MDALDAIRTRRSIRKFNPVRVGPEQLDALLRAAMQAPSAKNLQPRHFVVAVERARLEAFADFHPYAGILREAPLGILVCGDRSIQPMDGYLALDCAAATENLLLAAHALGLGAVWLGVYPREERMAAASQWADLPPHVLPVAMVAVGIPGEAREPADRFKPERVHADRWRGGAGSGLPEK